MDIYDKVADLASTLKDAPEFTEWAAAKEEVDRTVDEKAILQKYRACQLAVEFAGYSNVEVMDMESVNEELDRLFDLMMNYPILTRYLDAEEAFGRMVGKMQQIFAEIMDLPADNVFADHFITETGNYLN